MSIDSRQHLKRPLVVLAKVGYQEITSVIVISAVFWLLTIPVVTIGAALLALFEVMGAIYNDGTPSTEQARIKQFVRSVRRNLVKGIPLTLLVLFILVNTGWYFLIAVSERGSYLVIGGLVGIYACLLVLMFSSRVANIMISDGIDWGPAIRQAGASWRTRPHYTVLQVSIAAIAVIASIAFPIALLLLLPGGLALFELIFYDEMSGTNPRTVLARYRRDI